MALKSVGGGGGGGSQGPQGPKGDTGDVGPPGPANTLSIGTVTNGSAGASITGTAPNQTLSLVLPQGIQGIQGIQGNPGNDGSNGSNGLGWTARALKTSDQTLIGTSYVTVTGLDLALAANTSYQFEFGIIADADATTTGIDIAVTGPASPTQLHYTLESWTSATAKAFRGATGYDDNPANANSCGATARMYMVRGIIRNGTNAGNLSPRAKREAVGTGPNVRAGSYGLLVALS